MLRLLLRMLAVAIVAVVIYKACGGDVTQALDTAWSAFYNIVDSTSDWLLTIPFIRDLLT